LGVALASLAAASTVVSNAGGPCATDWPSTNYDQSANRYSPLTQITAKNVSTLQQVWSVHLKPADFIGRMREDEAIPIVIGNTMYLASPYGAVIAWTPRPVRRNGDFSFPTMSCRRSAAWLIGRAEVVSLCRLRSYSGRPRAGFTH